MACLGAGLWSELQAAFIQESVSLSAADSSAALSATHKNAAQFFIFSFLDL